MLLLTEKPLALLSDTELAELHEGHAQAVSALIAAPNTVSVERIVTDYALSLAELARRDTLMQVRSLELPLPLEGC